MGLKSEVVTARQLYLYGAGDGKRVLNVQALAEASGLHEKTVWKYLPAWQKEMEEMCAAGGETTLALRLSKESLISHEKDMSHLRNLVEANKWEMGQIDEITAKLEGWMDKFNGEDGEQDKALRILELWVRTCGQKSNLQSQFLALQRQWTSLSGVVDLKDVQVTKEKALATGRAKLELKKEEPELGIRDVGSNLAAVFHRDV